jgi:hypothetical protein
MTVIAGEEFTITVPFLGSPLPKVAWTVNAEEVFPDDRIKFDTKSGSTAYINKCARRTDSGKYTIQLVNSEGSDTASCRVLVVDKPGPPQGPLECTDITPETCSLSWRVPLDDGMFLPAHLCICVCNGTHGGFSFYALQGAHLSPTTWWRNLTSSQGSGSRSQASYETRTMMSLGLNQTKSTPSASELRYGILSLKKFVEEIFLKIRYIL